MPSKHLFLQSNPQRWLLVANVGAAIIYFFVIAFLFPHGNQILFWLLIAGEIFHTWQALSYIYTVWNMKHKAHRDAEFVPPVDVFVTVCGEPVEVLEETVVAALNMDYPAHRIFILNDGYVAKKDNWQEVEVMARRVGVTCITRKTPGGAKAGNINNALRQSSSPFVVVFDTDHVPHKDFLSKTIGYFIDKKLAFVQTPQYYKNAYVNAVALSSWEQQELFFGPICRGKNRLNSVTMCGTNMVIRREALLEVGGMAESIAEDFVTGVFLHQRGWKSLYVPEVLAEGMAPEDFLSYTKQQFRWARGALDVLFRYNLLFRPGLSFAQRVQYLSSVTYFLSGTVVLMNILLPLLFLYFGLVPVKIDTMLLAAVFVPYMLLTVGVLASTSNRRFSFRALSFSISSFWIHIRALWSAMTGQKVAFSVTSKEKLSGNFLGQVVPHIMYVVLVVCGIIFAAIREGLSASVVNNVAWALFNVGMIMPYIVAAAPEGYMRKNLSRIYEMMFIPDKVVAARLRVVTAVEGKKA
ncbi:MAG TPA: glycosyltransferase [Candidatus Paceibacterota bacterium]|jgi:Glycosyltransferases, probably involved in cell wall biogenesis